MESAQEALRAQPSDSVLASARDVKKTAYCEALTALRSRYEERLQRGNKYAELRENLSEVVGSTGGFVEVARNADAVEMPVALANALPVLKKVRRDYTALA